MMTNNLNHNHTDVVVVAAQTSSSSMKADLIASLNPHPHPNLVTSTPGSVVGGGGAAAVASTTATQQHGSDLGFERILDGQSQSGLHERIVMTKKMIVEKGYKANKYDVIQLPNSFMNIQFKHRLLYKLFSFFGLIELKKQLKALRNQREIDHLTQYKLDEQNRR